MSRKCQLTGKGPLVGHNVSHSHRISKKRWNVNLQKVRVLVDGRVCRMRVCTKAIKSGLIEKPPTTLRARKHRVSEHAIDRKASIIEEEEVSSTFFSQRSAVESLFRKRRNANVISEEDVDEMNEEAEDIESSPHSTNAVRESAVSEEADED